MRIPVTNCPVKNTQVMLHYALISTVVTSKGIGAIAV